MLFAGAERPSANSCISFYKGKVHPPGKIAYILSQAGHAFYPQKKYLANIALLPNGFLKKWRGPWYLLPLLIQMCAWKLPSALSYSHSTTAGGSTESIYWLTNTSRVSHNNFYYHTHLMQIKKTHIAPLTSSSFLGVNKRTETSWTTELRSSTAQTGSGLLEVQSTFSHPDRFKRSAAGPWHKQMLQTITCQAFFFIKGAGCCLS